MFLDFAPNSVVTEAEISEKTGVGRTPVREAIQRLTWEGMVEVLPRRGIFIPSMSAEQQLSYLEVRRPLETLCVSLATTRLRPEGRREIFQLSEQLDAFDPSAGKRGFSKFLAASHHMLTAAAANEPLERAIGPSQALSRRFWFATMRDEQKELRNGAYHHARILEAVGKGKHDEAVANSSRLLDYLTDFTLSTVTDHFDIGTSPRST